MNELVFKAIADKTRRDIVALLGASSTPLTIKQITWEFDMSRQAIRKHLDILAQASLVETQSVGRDTLVYVDLRPLKDLDQSVARQLSSILESQAAGSG